MTEWRINEFSKITQTSVRMLRHYDKLGLLKPSFRMPNGYRCYTERDLAKLQQIIALKYFGFKLNTIASILQQNDNIYAHLKMQQQVLKTQASHFQQVSNALTNILNNLSSKDTPDFHHLIHLIEDYRMTENLRDKLQKQWGGQLTEEQLQEMLFLYGKDLLNEDEATWDKWLEKINGGNVGDPAGLDGQKVAAFLYGSWNKKTKSKPRDPDLEARQTKLNSSINNAIASGELTHTPMTVQAHVWIWRACNAYMLKRWNDLADKITKNLNKDPESNIGKEITEEWRSIVEGSTSGDSPLFHMGAHIWSEQIRDEVDLKKFKSTPSRQDLTKFREKERIKLFKNPDALIWIKRALSKHG
jgi:DNA-binding transcriptional MerR regulator